MRLTEPELESPGLHVNECLALLDRISRSPQLRRASRLRELLIYIGRHSTEKGRTDLHEQEIGCAVFGRPPHYDTSQDNIVRVNATELRKRLENYFAADGAHEEWVLEIPRGGYNLLLSRRVASTPKRLRAPSLKVTLPHQSPIHRLRTQSGRRTSRYPVIANPFLCWQAFSP